MSTLPEICVSLRTTSNLCRNPEQTRQNRKNARRQEKKSLKKAMNHDDSQNLNARLHLFDALLRAAASECSPFPRTLPASAASFRALLPPQPNALPTPGVPSLPFPCPAQAVGKRRKSPRGRPAARTIEELQACTRLERRFGEREGLRTICTNAAGAARTWEED